MLSGIDGSGKSTVAEIIKSYVQSVCDIKNVFVMDAMKEGVYTSKLKHDFGGDKYRRSFSTELINLIYTGNLLHNYCEVTEKYLKNGYCVIMHRSDLCCRVYSKLFDENDYMTDLLLNSVPFCSDLHFYMDISPRLSYSRILKRNGGANIKIKESEEMLCRARDLYEKYLQKDIYKNVVRVNAESSINDIARYIEIAIDNNLRR